MRIPPEFEHYRSTVAQCSLDKEHGVSLVPLENIIVDFDEFKTSYVADFNIDKTKIPCSCDSLFSDEKDNPVFVEFKNGRVDKYDILRKVYDSVILYSDYIDVSMKKIRNEAKLILVYNSERSVKSMLKMGQSVALKASNKPLLFVPPEVRGYLYREVEELTAEEFADKYCVANEE